MNFWTSNSSQAIIAASRETFKYAHTCVYREHLLYCYWQRYQFPQRRVWSIFQLKLCKANLDTIRSSLIKQLAWESCRSWSLSWGKMLSKDWSYSKSNYIILFVVQYIMILWKTSRTPLFITWTERLAREAFLNVVHNWKTTYLLRYCHRN